MKHRRTRSNRGRATSNDEASPEFITSRTGRIISINDNLCRLIARTPHQLIGLNLEDLPHLTTQSKETILRRHASTLAGTPKPSYIITLNDTIYGTIQAEIRTETYKKKSLDLGEYQTITKITRNDGTAINISEIKQLPLPVANTTTDDTVALHNELDRTYLELSKKNNQLHDQLQHINNLHIELEHIERRCQHIPSEDHDTRLLQDEIDDKNRIINDLTCQLHHTQTQRLMNSRSPEQQRDEQIIRLEKDNQTKNQILQNLNEQLQYNHTERMKLQTECHQLKVALLDRHEEMDSISEGMNNKNDIIHDLNSQLHNQHHLNLKRTIDTFTMPTLPDIEDENLLDMLQTTPSTKKERTPEEEYDIC